ncbi:hypothetical protein [Photobacterium sanguinicancri]|nr:hypothetical protein [Photobacterium sanguinicancri]
MIITLVPYGDKCGIGVVVSPSIFDSQATTAFKQILEQSILNFTG